ncbi:MAG TPA: hypothetical protein VJY39_17675 [Acidisphaera sp.]|nr:hypothetical protein [Acidisphaera sp.]
MPTAVELKPDVLFGAAENLFLGSTGQGTGADGEGLNIQTGLLLPAVDHSSNGLLLPAVTQSFGDTFNIDANLLLPAVQQTFGDAPNPLAGLLLPAVDHSAIGLLLPAV